MRSYSTRRRTHVCILCGGLVSPDFAFDIAPGMWVHPDCWMYTHSGERTDVPSRTLKLGQKIVHTCGDANCVNPKHLEVRG